MENFENEILGEGDHPLEGEEAKKDRFALLSMESLSRELNQEEKEELKNLEEELEIQK